MTFSCFIQVETNTGGNSEITTNSGVKYNNASGLTAYVTYQTMTMKMVQQEQLLMSGTFQNLQLKQHSNCFKLLKKGRHLSPFFYI